MLTIGGYTTLFIVNNDIDDVFFKSQFLSILLEENIIVGEKGIDTHRSQIPGDREPSLPGFFLNGFGLPVLNQDDDQAHQEEDQESGVENESSLKTKGFEFFFRIHLDSETEDYSSFFNQIFFIGI
jgi:hypothetical protein